MSVDYSDNNDAPTYLRSPSDASLAPSLAASWPPDVDLDVWYQAERAEVEDIVRDALDLSVWSLEAKKGSTSVYLHCKNNEKPSYSVRAVTRVTGTVTNVTECFRSPDSSSFRQFTKMLHSKVFLDSEVLHAHAQHNRDAESLALKWVAFSNGKKTLGKGKEFCVREYTTVVRNHRQFGTFGVCKFESYDGVGARYGVRAKSDTFGLTLFEPSSYVVTQTPEEGIVSVAMTFSMRKATGSNAVSSGVKALSMRLAHDLGNLQATVQHLLFQPASLANKREWVSDKERNNCSLCVQTFGMLKRKHHCRVCGEVVCGNCTVFKVVNDQDSSAAKVRVCKACLGKSTTTEPSPQPGFSAMAPQQPAAGMTANGNGHVNARGSNQMYGNKNINLSVVSNSSGVSTSSEESRRSDNDADAVGALPPMHGHHHNQYKTGSSATGGYSSSISSTYSKGSSFSEADLDLSPRNRSGATGSLTQPPLQSMPSMQRGKQSSASLKRTNFFNDDFEEICMLAMQTLDCAMAGIRTDDFELVNYFDGQPQPDLPRSLPTFRRIASRGKPCIVLDVSADKRIAGEKRNTAKLQFFVGIPLIMGGEVIGDLCVADRYPRESIDHQAVEVLMVLGKTVTQYMTSNDYIEDLAHHKMLKGGPEMQDDGVTKEVAF
jgi:hypothetical protein